MAMNVQARDEMLWRAEDAILRIATTPTPTSILIDKLRTEKIDEYFVRAAILFLMDRGRIRMTEDRKVTVVPSARET